MKCILATTVALVCCLITIGCPNRTPIGQDFTVSLGNGIQMEMVWIPTGNFLMGSPESESGRSDDEGPQVQLSIDGFWMGKYEVTQAQYEAVMGPNILSSQGANIPVELVSWNDAMEFCSKLSESTGQTYTLPTEAQWEYACRAGSSTAYLWGDDEGSLGDYTWWGENSEGGTHPVGKKQPNGWGLYDMAGNVCEWCLSLYKPYPYVATDGRNSVDLLDRRVLRGGSWLSYDATSFRCACRYYINPSERLGLQVGFRCVRNP